MKQFLAAVLVAVLVIPSPVLAHGGRTDASGGHTDRSTGEYHYHHGYSAHQHPNGVCPYNFDDQTNHSSGSSPSCSPDYDISPPTPIVEEHEWVLVKDGFFSGYYHCEKTGNWKSPSGTIYKDAPTMYVQLGFKPNFEDNCYYGSSGFIDTTGNYCSYRDYDMFMCSECSHLIKHDNIGDHSETCSESSFLKSAFSSSVEIAKTILYVLGSIFVIFFVPLGFYLICSTLYVRWKNKTSFSRQYDGKSVRNLVGMPPDVFIMRNGLPARSGPGLYGEFYTVYTSRNGLRYHRTCGCSYARNARNFVDIANMDLTPCKLCNPVVLNVKWYFDYLDLLALEEKHGFHLLHDEYNPILPEVPSLR